MRVYKSRKSIGQQLCHLANTVAPKRIRKPPDQGGFLMRTISISRILSLIFQRMTIYLGVSLLKRSSGTPTFVGTALHPGKDLAVSLSTSDEIIPQTAFAERGTLVFRHRRHCSHLYGYPRRVLPATLLTLDSGWEFGLSSSRRINETRSSDIVHNAL